MKAACLVMTLAACATPSHRSFRPSDDHAAPRPQVVDCAIPMRDPATLLGVDGIRVGDIAVEGRNRVEAVREARRYAARVGGTHIVFRDADVTRIHSESTEAYVGHQKQRAHASEYEDGVQARFDVFLVPPARWPDLDRHIRPGPGCDDADRLR